jgi:diguanylate cyclase (GGDEF)-like protein/PAS domain S-box-containing protein
LTDHAASLAETARRPAAPHDELVLLREALEHMHLGLCMFDDDDRIVLCNRRYAEVLDLPAAAVRPGTTGLELIELGIAAGHRTDGKSAEEIHRELKEAVRAAGDTPLAMTRSGRTYAVRNRRTASGLHVSTCEDITAQVAAESALRESARGLRAMLDAMPDCVKIFDESGTLIYINPQGLELLQAPDMATLLSTPGYAPVPPEYLEACLDVHRRVMSGETVVWTYEVVGLEGRRRHVEAHAVPFRMSTGARAHMCISRDVNERIEADGALRRSEQRLRLVQEATGLAEFQTTPNGISSYSSRFFEQVGLPVRQGEITFPEWLESVHPDDRERLNAEVMHAMRNRDRLDAEFRVIHKGTGEVRWLSTHCAIERGGDGIPIRSIGAHLDITERKRAEEALRESEERFRLAAEAAGLGVWDYDLDQDRRDWSERLREIFGLAEDTEPSLETAEACIHPADRGKFTRTLRSARAADIGRFECTVRIRRADNGIERWVTMNGWRTYKTDSKLQRIIMTVRDVTDEKTAEERVRWSASHDPLTRLANRSLFSEKLDQAIRSASSAGDTVGLLLLDLDHFKQVNDTLGHDAGDQLLALFADRLRAAVRASDTVARLGGDEFAVVLPDIDGEPDLMRLTRSIQQRLLEPFAHAGQLLDCRVSMGASVYPLHGRTPAELLKNADIALYAAKAAGRASLAMFEPRMREGARRRVAMVDLARAAIADNRIVPYYQPKLDLNARTLVGFEALLRWRTPRGRIAMPAALEAAFEDLEVAAQLSDRMIERVIADVRRWLDQGVAFDHVAINASAAELRRDDFAERLLDSLRKADIPARCIQLEVTETVFLGRGAEYVHHALALLSARGVRIALDDFGTGYASLRHLKQFPVDIIKVDQSFVRDMNRDPGDEAIVRAVINLGRSLGIKVVAEGIETEAQAAQLIALQCDFGQGFLFSRAVPARRVPALAARWGAQPGRAAEPGLRLVASRG